MEQLHDIEGLDTIPLWPLAIGWWCVIAFAALFFSVIGWYLIKKFKFRRSWKHSTLETLNQMLLSLSSPSITDVEVRNAAIFFSEYLRRIALKKFSRSACAGLTDLAWLDWLSKHDLKNFDWKNEGKLLIEAPYAPVPHGLQAEQLKRLIQAAKEWVC